MVRKGINYKISNYIAKNKPQTPCLILDCNIVRENYRRFLEYFPGIEIFYAVKANPEKAVLHALNEVGASFDAASIYEIKTCLDIGVTPDRILYGNTIKKECDIAEAYQLGVRLFSFDCKEELAKFARSASGAKVFCRIQTYSYDADWPHSQKFGCSADMAIELLAMAKDIGLEPYGISFHVGSQQNNPECFQSAIQEAANVFARLEDIDICLKMLNMGGGFPSEYHKQSTSLEEFPNVIFETINNSFSKVPRLIIEPGRAIAGDAGIIISEIVLISTKDAVDKRRWIYLDIGIYGGLVETIGESIQYPIQTPHDGGKTSPVTIAGPTCDWLDILYEKADYRLPDALQIGDRVYILNAGAYTTSLSSVAFNGFPPLTVHIIGCSKIEGDYSDKESKNVYHVSKAPNQCELTIGTRELISKLVEYLPDNCHVPHSTYAAMAHLSAKALERIMFEFCLGAENTRFLDIGSSIIKPYWHDPMGGDIRETNPTQEEAWAGIRRVFASALNSKAIEWLHGIALEWESKQSISNKELPMPRLFISCEGLSKETLIKAAYPWILNNALTSLITLDQKMLKCVNQCIEALPENAKAVHFGTSTDRNIEGLRICITGLKASDIPEYLKSIGIDSLVEIINRSGITLNKLEELAELRFINIDVSDFIVPKIGVECHIRNNSIISLNKEWEIMFDYLIRHGLANTEDREILYAWCGIDYVSEDRLPIIRIPSHVKLQFSAFEPEVLAKAYMICTIRRPERSDLTEETNSEYSQQISGRMPQPVSCSGLPHTLHGLFIKQVSAIPESTALITSEKRLSYYELFQLSFALSLRLKAHGILPGTPVAVLLPRGWKTVVAVLGIAMSGAAYLPIDSNWPMQRIHHVIETAKAEIVVTNKSLYQDFKLNDLSAFESVIDDEDLNKSLSEFVEFVRPDDTAYIIFTSGSTGEPKGVVISHRAAANTIIDINTRFEVGIKDRVLAVSAITFDLSVYDIFGTLAAGGTIVAPEEYEYNAFQPNPSKLMQLMQKHNITIWNSVPALMKMLALYIMQAGSTDNMPEGKNFSVRLIMLSGDWIDVTLPNLLRALFPTAHLLSLGGATEASIWSILHEIVHDDTKQKSIPYGKPDSMNGQRIHVLDKCLNIQPVNEPGELYISGVGLALGYLNDNAKTQARFIKHPITGERLYRTGDYGYYREDGTIILLGRVDNQIKINGFRVEPSEIESLLQRKEEVVDSVVVGYRHGDRVSLQAFVVLNPNCTCVSSHELIDFLKESLPHYMIPAPAAFHFLQEIPHSSNGKVDRQALINFLDKRQCLNKNQIIQEKAFDNTTEYVDKIRDIWCRTLRLSRISDNDNFFDLGGSSMAAVEMLLLIRRELGLKLDIDLVYKNQVFHKFSTAALVSFDITKGRTLKKIDSFRNTIIKTIEPHICGELAELAQLCYPEYDRNGIFFREHYLHHCKVFPEGQFVAFFDDNVVGSISGFLTNDSSHDVEKTWREITGERWLHAHNSSGKWYYVADFFCHPDYRREDVAFALFEKFFVFLQDSHIEGVVGGAVIPGFEKHKNIMSIFDYIEKVKNYQLYDSVLSIYLQLGFQVEKPLGNYNLDPRTDNWHVAISARTDQIAAAVGIVTFDN